MNEKVYGIAYARVSTAGQAQFGESLDHQEGEMRRMVAANGWTLFPDPGKVFKESYTGTTMDRPVYQEILALIKANPGKVKYFIFWDFDRLTRSGDADYDKFWKDLAPLGVELRDCYGVIQSEVNYFQDLGDFDYDFAKGRPSEDAEYAKVLGARQERKKILRRLIKPQIKLTQEGYHIGPCDDGYMNKQVFVDNKKKCIQFPHPERAPFIIRMFELRAAGIHSDKEIVKMLNAEGYRTRERRRWSKDRSAVVSRLGGVPLTVKRLQEIISRYVYAGVHCEKWTQYQPVKTQYPGLVSIDLFNQANRGKVFIQENEDGGLCIKRNVLSWRLKKLKFNPKFPIRGVVRCDVCSFPMTASASRSKSGRYYSFYHCARKHKRVAHPKEVLEADFERLMNTLAFQPGQVGILEESLVAGLEASIAKGAENAAQMKRQLAELENQKAALIQSFSLATLEVVRKGIEAQIAKVQAQIEAVAVEKSKSAISKDDIEAIVSHGRQLMEHPAKMLEKIESFREQEALYGLIFESFPSAAEIGNGTPKLSPFFKLKSELENEKFQTVHPPSEGWNTLEKEILRWKAVIARFGNVFRKT